MAIKSRPELPARFRMQTFAGKWHSKAVRIAGQRTFAGHFAICRKNSPSKCFQKPSTIAGQRTFAGHFAICRLPAVCKLAARIRPFCRLPLPRLLLLLLLPLLLLRLLHFYVAANFGSMHLKNCSKHIFPAVSAVLISLLPQWQVSNSRM